MRTPEHAGCYVDDGWLNLQAFVQNNFASFGVMMRSLFDETLEPFNNRSVEILHLDGLRTYGAIKHDFETWVPKLSERGVILFHDTCVHDQDFGALAVMGGTLSASSAFQHDVKFHNIDYANLRLRNLLPHMD